MKRIFIFFVILIISSIFTETAKADRKGFLTTVVIDPGHGGKDPGAVGRRSLEKDIALSISLQVGQYINEHFKDVKVIYTRSTDEFIEVHRRAAIANENHADLFISIHCNSTTNSSAYGTETFVMGLDRVKANLEVAKKENAAILFEDNYMETYDGFDPNSPEANIIFTLYQNAYLDHSLNAASMVQEQFRERARRTDRGVKQAPFLVLYRVTMPGILVETGFLSNPKEEEYLMSKEGQAHIASAIFRAFRDYKEQHDAKAISLGQILTATTPTAEIESPVVLVSQPAEQTPPEQHTTTGNNNNIVFRIQFSTSSEKKPVDSKDFSPLKDVGYYFHDGFYKYTVGEAYSFEEAAILQQKVQQAGFKDAFVVAFNGEQRISPSEAIRIIKQKENNQ